jgi:hypothetical protein
LVGDVVQDRVREDRVEGPVGEVEALGVGELEREPGAVRRRGAPALGQGQHVRGEVDADDVEARDALAGVERDVPRAGADVERPAVGPEGLQPLDEGPVGLRVVHGVVLGRLFGRVHDLGLEHAFHGQIVKYLALGWWQTSAEVDCSGQS